MLKLLIDFFVNNFIMIFYLSPRWWFVIVDLLWLSDVLYLLICVSYFWIFVFIQIRIFDHEEFFLYYFNQKFCLLYLDWSNFLNNTMHNYNTMLILLFWLFVLIQIRISIKIVLFQSWVKNFTRYQIKWINLFIKGSIFYHHIIFHLLKFKSL